MVSSLILKLTAYLLVSPYLLIRPHLWVTNFLLAVLTNFLIAQNHDMSVLVYGQSTSPHFGLTIADIGLDSIATSKGAWNACDETDDEQVFFHYVMNFYNNNYWSSAQTLSFYKIRGSHAIMCPSSVLQTMLIKMESKVFSWSAEELWDAKTLFLQYLHDNIGRITPGWPLARGFERINMLEAELSKKKEYSIAMVMNFCKTSDRFGEAHGLDWLSSKSPLLEENPDLMKMVNVYIYLVDMPHCNASRDNFRHIEAVVGNLYVQRYTGAPEREEQTAYFRYIIDHYDNMEDFVYFVHPDTPEHIGAELVTLKHSLWLLNSKTEYAYKTIEYFPLAIQYITSPLRTSRSRGIHKYNPGDREDDWPLFWNRLFWERPNSICPSGCQWNAEMDREFAFYIASQAVVRNDRVRLQPKEWYESFLDDPEKFTGVGHGAGNYAGFKSQTNAHELKPDDRYHHLVWFSNNSGLLEAVWPVLMGEELTESTREADKRLPLALKIDFYTKFSHGDNDVI